MIPLLNLARLLVRNNYPRWRIQAGFSKQTLMTSNERVSSLLTLVLTMHNSELYPYWSMVTKDKNLNTTCKMYLVKKTSMLIVHILHLAVIIILYLLVMTITTTVMKKICIQQKGKIVVKGMMVKTVIFYNVLINIVQISPPNK